MNTLQTKLALFLVFASLGTSSKADTWLPVGGAAKVRAKQKPASEPTLEELENVLSGKTGKTAAEIAEIDFSNECNEKRAQLRDELYVALGVEDLKRYNNDISVRVGEDAFLALDIDALVKSPNPKSPDYSDAVRTLNQAQLGFKDKAIKILDKAGTVIAKQIFERKDLESKPDQPAVMRLQRTWQGRRDSVLFAFPSYALSRNFLPEHEHEIFARYNVTAMVTYLRRDRHTGKMKIVVDTATTNSPTGPQLLSSFVEEKISEECRQRTTPNETLIMAMNSDEKTVGEFYSRMHMSNFDRSKQVH